MDVVDHDQGEDSVAVLAYLVPALLMPSSAVAFGGMCVSPSM